MQHSISLSDSTQSQSHVLTTTPPHVSSFPFLHGTSLPISQQSSHQCHYPIRNLSLQILASIPPVDFQIFTDGSVRGGIEDSGAGLVVLSQNDHVHKWHSPTGTHSRSFQAEKAAFRGAIQWLSSISSLALAIIMCDCKLFRPSAMITQLTCLSSNCSLQGQYSPCHCGLLGNELADHQAKLGAAET